MRFTRGHIFHGTFVQPFAYHQLSFGSACAQSGWISLPVVFTHGRSRMRGIFVRLIFVIILTSVTFGQSADAPKFDAADVHVSPKSANPNVTSMGGFARAG